LERVSALLELEFRRGEEGHQHAFAAADGAVAAHGLFRQVGIDRELDRAAVTAALKRHDDSSRYFYTPEVSTAPSCQAIRISM
jgi:hypothetical protein